MSAAIQTVTQSPVLIAYVIAEDGSILPVYQPTTLVARRAATTQPAPTSYLDEEATWEDAAWY